MPSTPPRTSLLENMSFGPDGARFDLDGRPVRLDLRTQGGSVAALREFHGDALADYRERLARAGSKPSWWVRLLGGLGRWLGRRGDAAPAEGGPARPPAPGPEPRPAPGAPLPGREPRAVPARAAPRPSEPALRSVCADREGLHLVWRAPDGAGDLHATCPIDSPLGRRLQTCYAQLEQLGYEVVTLEGLRPAAAKTPPPEPGAAPAAPTPEKAPAPAEGPKPRRRAAAPAPAPEKEAPPPAPRAPEHLPGLE
jgi:hypothetical protein